MSIKLDRIAVSTLTGAYLNYSRPSTTITLSGTIADGDSQSTTVTIPYTRSQSIADVYLQSVDGNRILANTVMQLQPGMIYSYVSSEQASVVVTYGATDITIQIIIFNGTGGSITLTTQAITAIAVTYDAPFSAL